MNRFKYIFVHQIMDGPIGVQIELPLTAKNGNVYGFEHKEY